METGTCQRSPDWPQAAVGHRLSVAALEDMHQRKTGALIECSVLLGALAAGLTAGPELQSLQRFGAQIGLAFQIQDDILDVAGDPRRLGKSTGADSIGNTSGGCAIPHRQSASCQKSAYSRGTRTTSITSHFRATVRELPRLVAIARPAFGTQKRAQPSASARGIPTM